MTRIRTWQGKPCGTDTMTKANSFVLSKVYPSKTVTGKSWRGEPSSLFVWKSPLVIKRKCFFKKHFLLAGSLGEVTSRQVITPLLPFALVWCQRPIALSKPLFSDEINCICSRKWSLFHARLRRLQADQLKSRTRDTEPVFNENPWLVWGHSNTQVATYYLKVNVNQLIL